MNSIREMIYKIKEALNAREFLMVLLILLVGFGSFGLGRLSALSEYTTPVYIEYPKGEASGEAAVFSADIAENKKFIASKNGTKYHHPWCSGAQRISEENKIWFDSQEEAEKAGYTPAANCKGL